jgi:hypothetical protein
VLRRICFPPPFNFVREKSQKWRLSKTVIVAREQGDQIGRIFAQRVIVYFGPCSENWRSSKNIFAPSLFHG